ncbi:hypothetical protein AHAS_Ahas08G0091500 [Arachis hypogaea]
MENSKALWVQQNWLENKGILINKALNLDTVDAESLVWEWTKQNGEWDIDRLNQNLPPEIVMEIICKPPPQAENDDDRRGWRLSHDGNFSINSTYKELRKWPSEEKTIWKQLWSWRGPQRAKIFLWTAIHKKLMTNQRRVRIFGGAGNCTLCNGGQEDIVHVLRNCPKASTIWVNLVKTDEIPNFFQLEWDNWIEINLQQQLGKDEELDWRDVFITACWRIWQWRNKEIHEQQYRRPMQPYAKINKEAKKIKKALEKAYLIGQRRGRIERNVQWNPPPAGWIKLNSDGTTQGNLGTIGCGGILRDEEGRWIAGFSHKIGVGTAFMAELCGVKKGLEITWTMGFRKIVVEIYAGEVIKLLNKGENLASHPNAVVREIYELKRRN